MTRESIIEQVNAILAEEFEIDQDLFTPDANVKETLSLDSLSLVDLVAIIQHTYKDKNSRNRFTEDSDLQQSL